MAVVKTDLRVTRERAEQIRYYPNLPITATNMQDALDQMIDRVSTSPPAFTPTVVTSVMSPYTPGFADTVLLVDTTGGAVTISMPLSATRFGRPLIVKDDVGNSNVNAISINRAGAELIDGLSSYPIDSKYTAVNLQPKAVGGYDVV
jgi:hypothetical protein